MKEQTSVVLYGEITNTSNKQSKEFKTDNPRKSVYVTLDEENKKKAEAFGLTEYTPKDGGDPFFIIKTAGEVRVHSLMESEELYVIDGSDQSENFKSNGKVWLSLFKSEKNRNEFIRLTDILGDVEKVERKDPFVKIRKNLPNI